MGGRGSSSGKSKEAKIKKNESDTQFAEAIKELVLPERLNGGFGKLEYTNEKGKKQIFDLGIGLNRVMKKSFSEEVYEASKLSTEQLKEVAKKGEEAINAGRWDFNMQAPISRTKGAALQILEGGQAKTLANRLLKRQERPISLEEMKKTALKKAKEFSEFKKSKRK